jgi:hypothetical protein
MVRRFTRLRFVIPLSVLQGCSCQSTVGLTGAGVGGQGGAGAGGDGGGGAAEGGAGGQGGACLAEVLTDDLNCGQCDHACVDQPCSKGLCQTKLLLPPVDDAAPIGLLFSEEFVWVSAINAVGAGFVFRLDAPSDGSAWLIGPTWRAGSSWIGMTQSSTHIFTADAETLQEASKDGSGTILSSPSGMSVPNHLAQFSFNLFEANWSSPEISRYLVGTAGGPAVFHSDPNGLPTRAWEIEADAEYVYWTQRAASGGVFQKAAGGGELLQIWSTDGGVPSGLDLSDGYLYFSDCKHGAIYRRIAVDAQAPVELIASMPGTYPNVVHASGDHVYWFDLGVDQCENPISLLPSNVGRIFRAPITGTTAPLALAIDQGTTLALGTRADDAFLYWCSTLTVDRDGEGGAPGHAEGQCQRVAK